MGKYRQEVVEPPYKVHPIWRGIGCIMMIIIPIMSWLIADQVVQYGNNAGWPLMDALRGSITFPTIFYQIPYILNVAYSISNYPNLEAQLVFFLTVLIIFSGVMSVVYAMIYRVVGPPRYSPLDAPAQRVRTRRYKR